MGPSWFFGLKIEGRFVLLRLRKLSNNPPSAVYSFEGRTTLMVQEDETPPVVRSCIELIRFVPLYTSPIKGLLGLDY